MAFNRITVNSLGDYMNEIAKIEENSVKKLRPQILWFRGQHNMFQSLVPSLYRTKVRAERTDGTKTYTELHYAEDIRTQHYIAKNYHLLSSKPSSRVEWLEVMQHHLVKTRVLDWSESSLHALLFALEPFLDNQKYNELSRRRAVPCVWVLNPKKLNKKIMEKIKNDEELQEELMTDLRATEKEKNQIKKNMQEYGRFSRYAETEETSHIDYIFNLSSINDELLRDRSRLKQLPANGDVLNPYYYFLARIYSDGYLLKERMLPPLCVVQPYHSERIKAQKGVFSVFPFYMERENDKFLRDFGINPDALERNIMAMNCLTQIIIHNPQEVACQMMQNGLNDSWLYPEMPVVSSEIENHRIF